jgi:hypothetical protein
MIYKISTDTACVNLMLKSKIVKSVREYSQVSIPINRGMYKVTLSVGDTLSYNFINVTNEKDELMLGDSLYYSEGRSKKYDGGANLYGEGVLLDLGGDGDFSVKVTVKRIYSPMVDDYQRAITKAKDIYSNAKKIKLLHIKDYENYKNLLKKEKNKFNDKLLLKYKSSIIIHDLRESISLLELSKLNDLADKLMKSISASNPDND